MSSPMEVSPHNPRARREVGGVWNEDVLPVMEWEAAEHRVVLPQDLQDALEIDTPVLRWDREKYETVARQHSRDSHVIADVSSYLRDWQYHGEETGNYEGNHRVLFQDESSRWYAASIGPLHGSDSFITVFSSSRPSFKDNRLSSLRHVVKRGK